MRQQSEFHVFPARARKKQHERGEDKPDHVERQVSTEASRQMQEDDDWNDKRRKNAWFKSVFSVFLMCFLLVSHVVFVVSLVFFFLVFSCWLIRLFFLCFVVVVSTVSKLIVLCFPLVFLNCLDT